MYMPCVTVNVAAQAPQVSITGVSVIDTSTNAAVTSVKITDPLSKYALRITYSSTGTGKCTVTVTVNGQVADTEPGTIGAGTGGWTLSFDMLGGGKLAGKTIADLMSYFGITGSQIQICADISNITAA
jgi:hypothetical protein